MVLPSLEVMLLEVVMVESDSDTVCGRDPLMPGTDVDTEVTVDTAVDMVVMVDTDTESKPKIHI